MKIKHGVAIQYGVTRWNLTAKDLQLIADALDIINPDSLRVKKRARQLSAGFLALSEYAKTVKTVRTVKR
jgi:hypothetical protein